MIEKINCKNCNKIFERPVLQNKRANRYCSKQCSKIYLYALECRICKNIFQSRGRKLLCSLQCRKEDDRRRAIEWGKTKRQKKPKTQIKCEICFKYFEGFERYKYCSKPCQNRSKCTLGHTKQRAKKAGVEYDSSVS